MIAIKPPVCTSSARQPPDLVISVCASGNTTVAKDRGSKTSHLSLNEKNIETQSATGEEAKLMIEPLTNTNINNELW